MSPKPPDVDVLVALAREHFARTDHDRHDVKWSGTVCQTCLLLRDRGYLKLVPASVPSGGVANE